MSRGQLRGLLAGVLASAVGTGLTMPYLFVYLTVRRKLDLTLVGGLAGIGGLVGLGGILVAGRLLDCRAARGVLPTVLCISAGGSLVLALGRVEWADGLGIVMLSAGAAVVWPATATLIGRLADQVSSAAWFAREYAVLNLGIGIGSVAAAFFLRQFPRSGYSTLFELDALSFLIFAVMAASILGAQAPPDRPGVKFETTRAAGPLRDGRMWLLAGVVLLLVTAGYGQIESVLPAFLRGSARISPTVIGIAFLVNTTAVVVSQQFVPRLVRRWDARTRLIIVGITWSLVFLSLGESVRIAGTTMALTLVVAAFGVFALGETLQACSAPTLCNDLAPEHLRGRYNAFFGVAWQAGITLAPALGGVLSRNFASGRYLGTLVVLSLAASALSALLPTRAPGQKGSPDVTPRGVPSQSMHEQRS